MRLPTGLPLIGSVLSVLLFLTSCVDSFDQTLRGTVNVVVVDGTITNLAEPQIIRLNRSKADPATGRFGTTPITKATVDVVVDSAEMIVCHETVDGNYQLPNDFRGKEGHAYQLRFTLADGTQYSSNQQVMPAVVPIARLYQRFNPTSLPAQRPDGIPSLIRGASEFYIDWQDPVSERNYYRWEWKLWERQEWCHTCAQGFYFRWQSYDESLPREECERVDAYAISQLGIRYFVNDYQCRTRCWEVIYGYAVNLFDDALTNGSPQMGRRVAQIPCYQYAGCLVEVRQSALTGSAHRYFKQVQEQGQNTGGLADTPPAAPIGNVRNSMNSREAVVGYFTASSVSAIRYWLDRKDATGKPPGLFQALNNLEPSPEGVRDPNTGELKHGLSIGGNSKNAHRPPTAVCELSDSRTPVKPDGWRD